MIIKKKIYIVGGGWATKGFLDNIDYTLYDVHVLSNNENFIYQPFLASSLLNKEKTSLSLKEKYPSIQFEKVNVTDFDFKNNKVITQFKESEKYDYLILCHGSVINDFNIKGLKENSYYLKNDYDALQIKNIINELPNESHIVIMGCGLTGSEIIGHLIDNNCKLDIKLNDYIDGLIFFDRKKNKKYNVHAIDGLPSPLNIFNEKLRLYTLDLWKKHNINLHFGSFVKSMDNKIINLNNGKKIEYDLAIWAGGIKIHPLSILINKKLEYKNNYGIPVNDFLKIEKLDNVWAVGDCAHSGYAPNAQVAYQQGKYLAKNFNNKFENIKKFNFQNKGQVCYIGNNEAVYQNDDICFGGLLGYGMMKLVKIYTKFL